MQLQRLACTHLPDHHVSAMQGGENHLRAATAALLGRLTEQPLHGPRVVVLLHSLLPPSLVSLLQAGARLAGPVLL